MNILITGGAGYIGSHTTLSLLEAGYNVTILDDLSTGYEKLIPKKADFIKCNINDTEMITSLLQKKTFSAVMHFAGSIKVEESVKFPEKYFTNNTNNSEKLFATCLKNDLTNIIFSSTAAVYGNPTSRGLVNENAKLNPLNPYGKSKAKTENLLLNFNKDKRANYIILRYFNVAGADQNYEVDLFQKIQPISLKLQVKLLLVKEIKLQSLEMIIILMTEQLFVIIYMYLI